MKKTKIKLEEVSLPSYIFSDNVTDFDCGVGKINNFLVNEAEEAQIGGTAATTLFINKANEKIIAFYTVHISINEIKDKVLNQAVPISSMHLAYFAVDKEYQNKGIGTNLMKHLMADLLMISQTVGFSAMTVESMPNSYDFYCKCGFEDVDPEKAKMNQLSTYDLMIPYKRIFNEL